ncbi:integral membrane protein MviN [Candidatus Blochmanniella vafra str. BVAF]|uniref:Probable lipid II flippase MurJ n=1 Tax=Blochmanniella vafra (strain BVAF) TaxID=859654 RepID=E8Q720_BLOVB|nr:murein biosynthesis integral membrane protein MurJ [Candidatus Blochmannia vafer]ADV33844.1 integral membrane protein MviN [Candidatus Blochmannia vafer str. BVAF]
MNLLKPLIRVSFITTFSRVLGFIRDNIIARTFGASIMTDAFFVAFKLSNFLRRIFAEGACYQIFLPILSEYKCFFDIKEIKTFISRAFGLLIIILIIIIFFGLLLAPWIIRIAVPGFDNISEKFDTTVLLFRIMIPYILLISLASFMGATLNTWNFFLVPAFIPIFLNISMIGFMLCSKYLYLCTPIVGLSWSVFVGGLLQCIYCLPFLKKVNLLVCPTVNLHDNRIHRICRSAGLMLVAVLSNQISLTINTIFASFLPDGSISWIYYADRIIELPIGIFGVTLTTVLLPCLSRFIAIGSSVEYFNLINWGLKLCCVLSFPSAVILGVLSKPLIITLFQYGKFSGFDVLMTQYSVIAYSIGLPGLILTKVLTAGFYSRHDIQTPIRMIIITVVFSQFINMMFIHILKHVAFACSISLGAWLNAGLLFWQFKKKYLFRLSSGWLHFLCKLVIALCFMYIAIFFMQLLIYGNGEGWVINHMFYRLLKIISILILGISSYLAILKLLGFRVKDFFWFHRDTTN